MYRNMYFLSAAEVYANNLTASTHVGFRFVPEQTLHANGYSAPSVSTQLMLDLMENLSIFRKIG
jgi:hypothetical protein